MVEAGIYWAFIVDLGNYGRNNVLIRAVFKELRSKPRHDFEVAPYHWRRSGNFMLRVRDRIQSTEVANAICLAMTQVSRISIGRPLQVVARAQTNLQKLIEYATEMTSFESRNSMTKVDGKLWKVVAVFLEPQDSLPELEKAPMDLNERVKLIGTVEGDPSTVLTLYGRPTKGGNMRFPAIVLRRFLEKLGVRAVATARAISVIYDITSGRGVRTS